MKEETTDIIVIGAGASGLMAAYFCSQKDKKVHLIDHNKEVGKKILISGGGKCNFTNIHGESTDYLCNNIHFVKSALKRFGPWDFVSMLEEEGVEYYEKKLGQLFCTNSAKDINKVLLKKISRPNVELMLDQKNIQVEKNDHGFIVFNKNIKIQTKSLIIATGGIVLPSIGASDFGYQIAKKYGHKIIPPTPALVPLKIPGFESLTGNAFVAGITCNDNYIEEEVLFTHKGLSGPCILKISLFWNPGDEISINWLPKTSIEIILKGTSGKVQINSVLKKYLPNKFVEFFFDRISIDGSINIATLSKVQLNKINTELHSMKIVPEGTEGFRKAEVTKGGIDTSKVSSKTMESMITSNLYFIGEVLDVTGQLGGHNFQWCWSSAHAVGKALQ